MVDRTFGDLADDYANHAHDRPWFDARHAHLSEFLTAFWLGEFEDKSGDCQLSIQLASNYRAAPDPCTRELLFRFLPTGAPWMPAEVRYCDPSSPPYDVLARIRSNQYPQEILLHPFERITISDENYHAWLRSHQKERPSLSTWADTNTPKAPVGRPSLQIEIEDACNELITNKKADLDSRKPNYEPIRQIIREKLKKPPDADIKGLTDEAIRKAIAPILDDAKAASHKLSQKL